MMSLRAVFISDVHLGTPDCRADQLLSFLQQLNTDSLYLVGDIIDLESLAVRAYWPPSHAAVLGQILTLAATGTRVIYLPGNHDAALRGLVGQTISAIEVRRYTDHLGADGRRYRVSHGDEYDPERLGKDWLVWIGEHARRLVCWMSRGLNRVRRQCGLPYLPLPIVAKSRIQAAIDYIQEYEQRVVDAAREQGYDGHICGHIHFGAIREVAGIRYMNDGDWVEHCTALSEDWQGNWSLLHWTERATELALANAERVHAWLPSRLPLSSLEALRQDALRPKPEAA